MFEMGPFSTKFSGGAYPPFPLGPRSGHSAQRPSLGVLLPIRGERTAAGSSSAAWQARVVQLHVERDDVSLAGVEIRLRTEGLAMRSAGAEGRVMAKPTIKSDGRTITVRVPISIRKGGSRKVVLATAWSTIYAHCAVSRSTTRW